MEIAQIASLLIAACALVMSVLTYVRAGRWKDSDAAQTLLATLSEHEKRLTAVEVKVSNLATKADIAKLEADFRSVEKQIQGVDEGVTRIERFLMERAV